MNLPFPSENLTNVELTLEPARPQGLRTIDDGYRLLPLNFVCGIAHPAESVSDTRHQTRGDETVETLELPHNNAYRLVGSLKKILNPQDPCHRDNQAIFQYVGGLRKPLDAPVYRAHKQAVSLRRPGQLPLRPNSLYSISKDWQSPVHRAFLSLANPERSLIIEERRWWVANTRDLAKLGGIVTVTALLKARRSHSA